MNSVEKLQQMEDRLVARVVTLEEQGKRVPRHFGLWLSLVSDALNQHQKMKANLPLIR